MFKNIIRYLTVIAGLTFIFLIVTKINCVTTDKYPDLDEISIKVDSSICQVDSLDDALHNTIVYRKGVNSDLFKSCNYALFVDDTTKYVYASKNAHRRMYPASMTKFVTASVVCDKIEAGEIGLDDMVTITQRYDLTYEGVEPCQLTPGCKISVKDLLYGLLIQSNNYYAIILAEYVAGDIPSFCDLMNSKVQNIGATNSHFANPHGLDDPDHYTTAYDIYLITKEAYNHEIIRKIDTFEKYSYSYYNSNGELIAADAESTNFFMLGLAELPANYQIEIWKTGTTSGAGNCLTMYLTKDNHTYIVIASCDDSKATLYDAIIKLLCMVG